MPSLPKYGRTLCKARFYLLITLILFFLASLEEFAKFHHLDGHLVINKVHSN